MFTNKDRWIVSVMAGVLFLIVSLPCFYMLANNLARLIGLNLGGGVLGLIVQAKNQFKSIS